MTPLPSPTAAVIACSFTVVNEKGDFVFSKKHVAIKQLMPNLKKMPPQTRKAGFLSKMRPIKPKNSYGF